jgi:hypothetical protein
MGIVVLVLMGVDSCAPAGGASPVGGGGGHEFEPPPEDTGDTGGEEKGGTPGTLTNCDPEYDAVWVQCSNGSTWIAHAEMNAPVVYIDVAFKGTGKGDVINETPKEPGVFEGELRYAKAPCDQPNSFYFQAFGAMLSTYECTYDYTP